MQDLFLSVSRKTRPRKVVYNLNLVWSIFKCFPTFFREDHQMFSKFFILPSPPTILESRLQNTHGSCWARPPRYRSPCGSHRPSAWGYTSLPPHTGIGRSCISRRFLKYWSVLSHCVITLLLWPKPAIIISTQF